MSASRPRPTPHPEASPAPAAGDRAGVPGKRRAWLGTCVGLAATACSWPAAHALTALAAQADRTGPPGVAAGHPATYPTSYPASYADMVARAVRAGTVNVYASTDLDIAQPLLAAFETRYPGLKVRYRELNSLDLHRRFLAESAQEPSDDHADVLWSTAMDLQIKLVNDGMAMRYASPERAALPGWAAWRDEAWGTTFEPVVIVYNRKALAGMELPRSRSGLARLLQENAARWRGKVITYDVETAGLGYLLAQQDARLGDDFWYLAQTLGRCAALQTDSTAEMVTRVASGELVLGYNVLGSYALSHAERGAEIGIIAPKDYTLVISRVALLSRRAPHPDGARLWLDFLLSRAGQALLSSSATRLYTVRTDIVGEHTAAVLSERLGYTLRPISVGPGLLAGQDTLRKRAFVQRWREALRG